MTLDDEEEKGNALTWCKPGDKLLIGEVEIRVLKTRETRVRLQVIAPKRIKIIRQNSEIDEKDK